MGRQVRWSCQRRMGNTLTAVNISSYNIFLHAVFELNSLNYSREVFRLFTVSTRLINTIYRTLGILKEYAEQVFVGRNNEAIFNTVNWAKLVLDEEFFLHSTDFLFTTLHFTRIRITYYYYYWYIIEL